MHTNTKPSSPTVRHGVKMMMWGDVDALKSGVIQSVGDQFIFTCKQNLTNFRAICL